VTTLSSGVTIGDGNVSLYFKLRHSSQLGVVRARADPEHSYWVVTPYIIINLFGTFRRLRQSVPADDFSLCPVRYDPQLKLKNVESAVPAPFHREIGEVT
jgi:hypothetical protein